MNKKPVLLDRPLIFYGVIGIVGFAALLAMGAVSGFAKPFPPASDQAQYLGIGESIAQGKGYKDPESNWPNLPAYDRMPVWPAILSAALAIAPHARPETVSRLTNILCLVLAGISFGAFCRHLGIRPVLSLIGGLFLTLSPMLTYYALEGLSDISFVCIVGAALALASSGPRYIYPAALLLGLGPLVRTNFILVFLLFLGLVFLIPSARALVSQWNLRRAMIACALAFLPTGLWAIRNFSVTGRFPVLSSLEGETLYGANNDATANNLKDWGYWVVPDKIPGETPKNDLANRFSSALELNDYYHDKAVAWIRGHLTAMPRLVVGKMVRAATPVPWADFPARLEFAAFFSRFVADALILISLPFWWPRINRLYLTFLAAIAIGHLITTVVFYGSPRFGCCFFEVFFIPCIFFGMEQWLALRAGKPVRATT